ncbi:hypothetical protein HYR99_40380 [Candidatus Poribacteria bacterium]|nr:hypothetical protein [Candidatus Poribacteria bacterium]
MGAETESPAGGPSPDPAQSRMTVYQVAAQQWAHAEQIRWTLLYNYLMASTILLLAWATVFTSNQPLRGVILAILAIGGTFLSVLWVALGARASGFVAMYARVGVTLEDSIQPPDLATGVNIQGPFTSAKDHRQAINGIARLVPSRFVVSCVPGMFAILYVFLTFISLYALFHC